MSPISIRDAYARRIIKASWHSAYEGLPLPPLPPDEIEPESRKDIARALSPFSETFDRLEIGREHFTSLDIRPIVGIIGAGVAGLYAGMILESLGVDFEILEASNRIGGRLLTHYLPEKDGELKENEYYDVGAMRFPDNPLMKRTFDLFKRLKFTTDNKKLIIYHMSTKTDTYLYNNIPAPASELQSADDVFGFSIPRGGTVPEEYFIQGYQHWINLKIDWLRDLLKKDFEGAGWDALMKVDRYSMRSYMSLSDTDPSGQTYPTAVINWCETLDVGTGMYDNALSESVIDSLDFDYEPDVVWYAVQGGAEEIAKAMVQALRSNNQPIVKKRVTGISPIPLSKNPVNIGGSPGPKANPPSDKSKSVAVTVEGEMDPRIYEHVISTIPFGMLRLVDTRACGFPYALDEAIRSLRYDASVKVAIKFTERWWERCYNQKGGLSKTDRPTRVVVYPSYGIDGKAAVLLASYSWSQDALRFGALVQGNESEAESVLINIILRDISDIYRIPLSKLTSLLMRHDAFDWYHNEFSGGAFALFGPEQFRCMYPEVTKPAAGGLFHFAGEATSASHAWVVGALNSAYRCVEEILVHNGDIDRLLKLEQIWGQVGEVQLDSLVRQVAIGIHESTKLAKDYDEIDK